MNHWADTRSQPLLPCLLHTGDSRTSTYDVTLQGAGLHAIVCIDKAAVKLDFYPLQDTCPGSERARTHILQFPV